jgi:hypothetical protein
VIGGYDEGSCNFSASAATSIFSFNRTARPYDHFRLPTVTIAVNTSTQATPLSITLKDVLIDTSTPFVWLPEDMTNQIADFLGLKVNSTYGPDLFIAKGDDINRWWKQGTKISFTVPSALTSAQATMVGAPGEWWKRLHIPSKDSGTNRVPTVPIKALPANESPVLGLAFFTFACMLANYDTGTFAIAAQSARSDGFSSLKSTDHAFSDKSPSHDKKRRNVIIPAVVASVATILLILVVFVVLRRRKRAAAMKKSHSESLVDPSELSGGPQSAVEDTKAKTEINRTETNGTEIGGTEIREIDGKEKIEFIAEKDSSPLVEAAGHPLPKYMAQVGEEPVELDGTPIEEMSGVPVFHKDWKI